MSQIDELRRIIVGDNSEQLSALKERIESIDARTKDVAEVLAPAIGEGIRESDDIIKALQKPVSEGLKRAIRSEPVAYADILYPAIAPSIRLAISQAISSLLTTINQTMESATSISGLSTRMESARTGIPYAELALRKALLYRVEHIYLIDRETGLLIEECAATGTSSLDSDAVSAMFSAIQSFVQDSFSGSESDRLTDLKVGAHNVWIAHGPKAMLACVILGDAPESLKLQLNNCLDQIRIDYSEQLTKFDGDPSGFEGVDVLIRPLLQLRLKERDSVQKETPFATKLLVVLFIAIAAYLALHWFDKQAKLKTVQHYLTETPGLLVTSAAWKGDHIVVDGLQDPDARLPFPVLKAHGIDSDALRMRTTPFRSLETKMEISRFSTELNMPERVHLSGNDKMPALIGEAPIGWLLENDLRLRQLAGDRRLNIQKLTVSVDSVNDLIDEVAHSQTQLVGRPDFAEIRSELKSSIIRQIKEVTWAEIPASSLSRSSILEKLHLISSK